MKLEIAPPKRDGPPIGRHKRGLSLLLRLCAWGGGATLALAAVAITIRTDTGSQRLRETYAAFGNSAVAAIPAREKDAETRALEAQVRALIADRERMAARMASLERHLDDMTGSIQRQTASQATSQATPNAAPTPAPQSPPIAAAPAVAATTSPPPSLARVAALPSSVPAFDPLARPVLNDTAAGWPAADEKDEPQLRPDELEGQMAVPLPPPRFIAAPPEPPPLPKVEFGIELGSAATMEQLRARWTTVKANYGPLLTGLQPIAVRERRPNGGTEYKLIAGPVAHLTAARQLCARFVDAHAVCRPAKFDADQVVQR